MGDTSARRATRSGDTATTYQNYVGIYDDSQAIYVEVPAEWADVDGTNWIGDDGTVLGSSLYASPSIEGYNTTYSTPGMQILAGAYFGDTAMSDLLDLVDYSSDCTYDGRSDYSDPVYTGHYDMYSNCSDAGSVIIVLAAEPAAQNYSVLVQVQVVSDADLDALDHILNTFNVVGTLPGQ